MSLKHLAITLMAAASAAYASVPQKVESNTGLKTATCEVKAERKVASCGVASPTEETIKASEQKTSSGENAPTRSPFHHVGRMGA